MTGAEPAENPGDWIGADPAWKLPTHPIARPTSHSSGTRRRGNSTTPS